jgi:hypothetical protein
MSATYPADWPAEKTNEYLDEMALANDARQHLLLAAPIHRQWCFSEILVRGDFGCGSSFGFFAA